MHVLVALAAASLLVIILWDAFEVIVLPRRVSRRWRLARFLYRLTWPPWVAVGRRISVHSRRESFLGVYGPLSLLLLLGMWAVSMMLGFGALHWSVGSTLNTPAEPASFGTYVYLSGTTFFTLGLGDVTPRGTLARGLTVLESGLGFGFLALVIGYFPVLYSAFSRREASITLMDRRAGSPPSVGEMLRRHGRSNFRHLEGFLREWERWTADLMESHLSYPVLAYYRSQHANQSWLSALTAILDTCALLLAADRENTAWQARLTFAIARHAVVDLAKVFHLQPRSPSPDRLSPSDLARLIEMMEQIDQPAGDAAEFSRRLDEVRRTYEPQVYALARHLMMPLPDWIPPLKPTA